MVNFFQLTELVFNQLSIKTVNSHLTFYYEEFICCQLRRSTIVSSIWALILFLFFVWVLPDRENCLSLVALLAGHASTSLAILAKVGYNDSRFLLYCRMLVFQLFLRFSEIILKLWAWRIQFSFFVTNVHGETIIIIFRMILLHLVDSRQIHAVSWQKLN